MEIEGRIYTIDKNIDGCHVLEIEISKNDFEALMRYDKKINSMEDIWVDVKVRDNLRCDYKEEENERE